jgi:hypothetical protein
VNKLPAAAWVCLTLAFLGILGAFVYLSAVHVDTGDFYRLLNVIFNLVTIVLAGGGVVLSGQAREKATAAADQTNGQLDQRIAAGVQQALTAQRATDVKPGGVFHE